METTEVNWFTSAADEIAAAFGGGGHLAAYKHSGDGSEADRFWQQHVRIRPAELVRRVLAGMNGYVNWDIQGIAQVEIDQIRQLDGAPRVTVLIRVDHPKGRTDTKALHQLTVKRSFVAEQAGLRVHEDWTDCDGAVQPRGGGQQLYRNLLPLYDDLGVRRVTLETKLMGNYVWATYGFIPVSDAEWGKITREVLASIQHLDLVPIAEARTREWLEQNAHAIAQAANGTRANVQAQLQAWQVADRQTTDVDESSRDLLVDAFLEQLGDQAGQEIAGHFAMDMNHIRAFLEHLMTASGLPGRLQAQVIQPLLQEANDRGWRLHTKVVAMLDPNAAVPTIQAARDLVALLDRPQAATMLDVARLAKSDPATERLVSSVLQVLGPTWNAELILTEPKTDGRKMLEARIKYGS